MNAANAAAVTAANPCIPSIVLAAVNAANAAAVAATNHCVSIEFPLAPIGDVLEPMSSTLPAEVAVFSVANIMPTAVLAPTAKLVEVCPYRDSSLGNRDPYVGILVPTHNPLP